MADALLGKPAKRSDILGHDSRRSSSDYSDVRQSHLSYYLKE